MKIVNPKEPLFLLFGDLALFGVALWLTLLVRHLSLPTLKALSWHIGPFSVLFAFWLVIFFIAGLYAKQTMLLRRELRRRMGGAFFASGFVAVLFFYLTPGISIEPKTNLFIYLIIAAGLLYGWRRLEQGFSVGNRRRRVAMVGGGPELHELARELQENPRYRLHVSAVIDTSVTGTTNSLEDMLVHEIASGAQSDFSVIVDLDDPKIGPLLPQLYTLMLKEVTLVDFHKVYEEVFDRVPLSLLKHSWFLTNLAHLSRGLYDIAKRVVDVVVAVLVGVVSLVVYPFVYLAIILDDNEKLFITQERIGRGGHLVRIKKFRSMSGNDGGVYGQQGTTSLRVTRVGGFLRKSRIDELPQLWNVVRGDLSLIGPRPELPALVSEYEARIPYYNVRHLVTPGLSGWAQIRQDRNHPHHGVAVEQTKEKLSYDIYYVKNRSFWLDMKITLQTIRTLLSRSGS